MGDKARNSSLQSFLVLRHFLTFARKSYLGSGHKGVSAHPVSPETKHSGGMRLQQKFMIWEK